MAPVDWNTAPANAEEKDRRRHCNAFMMDFENWALRRWAANHPTGPERFKVKAWADHMKEALEDSDTTWPEYVEVMRDPDQHVVFWESKKHNNSTKNYTCKMHAKKTLSERVPLRKSMKNELQN